MEPINKFILFIFFTIFIALVVYYSVIYFTTPEEDLENPEKSKPNYKLAYFLSFLSIVIVFYLFRQYNLKNSVKDTEERIKNLELSIERRLEKNSNSDVSFETGQLEELKEHLKGIL